MRDHSNERGWVHPLCTGRYEYGYRDENGYFVCVATSDKALI